MQEYSELLRIILEKRGIKNKKEALIFLNPDYERDFHNPFLMRDMDKSCIRVFEAIQKNEKIVIYADYDCDGIPGAVILQDLFKKINYKNYEVYIPGRNDEGYGLSLEAIEEFSKKNVKLLITIDLGITAIKEVEQAKKYNIDVIITDHHLPQKDKLPKAFAILNPKIDDYPEKMLCGAGVVFKFICAFVKKYCIENQIFKIKNGWEKWMLDMAGLATLSDMVPLVGENRAIAYFGMKVLRKSSRPGLISLLKKINIDQRYLVEDDVVFMITPRINAASRMDNPKKAFELLSTDDEVNANILANYLSKINDDRKNIVAQIMREVNKKLIIREQREVLVIGNPKWRVGVLGLVAGKLADEYKKPVFVWGKDENDCIKGSCRSPNGISIIELMTNSKSSFLEFGGHHNAGGFSVYNEKIHFLEDDLVFSFNKIKKEILIDDIFYDIKADLSMVNMKNWNIISKLAPFGLGNPKPIFLFEGVKIEKIKKFGKNGSGEHLEIIFSNTGKNKIKAISFFSNVNSFKVSLLENINVNLLATFDLSYFGGKVELRLRILDIY